MRAAFEALPGWLAPVVVAAAVLLALLAWLAGRARRDPIVHHAVEALEDMSWRDRGRVALAIARDPRVPLYVRVLPILLAGYLVLPIDIIPDFIPVLGQLDDILVAGVTLWLIVRALPPEVIADHFGRLPGGSDD